MILLFFLTALLYATVGLGGGSTYIALLAASGLSHTEIPQISLLCNIVVVAGSCIQFTRAGHGDLRRLAPFLVSSIPLAYVGGRIPLSKGLFMVLLGLTLLVAGLRLVFHRLPHPTRAISQNPRQSWAIGLGAGATLGLLSGMVGIGGGIFLAPVLYFLRWDGARGIAAATSFFILFNSLSGLAGQLGKGGLSIAPEVALPLMLAVFIGGQIGSRMAVRHVSPRLLQQLTGAFVLSVAVQLLWKAVG